MDRLERETSADALKQLRAKLAPMPLPHTVAFSLVPADAGVATAAATAMEVSKGNLRDVANEDWERRHALIMEEDARALAQDSKRQATPCLAAGMCLCKGDGRRTRALTTAFYNAFKAAFPRGSSARSLVRDGFVVCHLWNQVGGALPARRQRRAETGAKIDHWLHIGLLYLSPLRATFSELRLLEPQEPLCDIRVIRVGLRATGAFFTDFQAMRRLCLDDAWYVDFYTLDDRALTISRFLPGEVDALRRSEASTQIWPRRASRGARHTSGGDPPTDDGEDAGGGSSASSAASGWSDADSAAEDCDGAGDESSEWLQQLWSLQEDDIGGAADEANCAPAPGAPACGPSDAGGSGSVDEPASRPLQGMALGAGAQNLGRGASGALGKQRRPPAAYVEVSGGSIAFYTSNKVFQAMCSNPFHGACVLTRKNTRLAHMGGRPLGLMMSWLAMAPVCDTKEAHWEALAELLDNKEFRAAQREVLAATAGGAELLAYERAASPGEDLEPTVGP